MLFWLKAEFLDVIGIKVLRVFPQSTHRVSTAAFWHTFRHDGKISPGLWGCGCQPTTFHYSYHHVQSCSVRSSWVGRYTHPVSSRPIYVLTVCTLWVFLWILLPLPLLSKSGLKPVWNVNIAYGKHQVWELSRLCPETSTKLYVHEFDFSADKGRM